MSEWLAEARKEFPKPTTSMDYLDGYLNFCYTDHDAPDGAWFAMCVGAIADHWPDCDAHETFMNYIEWKEREDE